MKLLDAVRQEWTSFRSAWGTLDPQTTWVLGLCCLFGLWTFTFGERASFKVYVAPVLGVDGSGMPNVLWRYGSMGLVGFAIPVLILAVGFRRKPSEIGLGVGDWKFALAMLAIWIPVATIGSWVLSDLDSFGFKHPYYKHVRGDWSALIVYEALFLLYWLGWEYLWRGFTLFGTAPKLGHYAIFVQALPFAAFHLNKPWPEAYLSVIGGIVLGAIVWRCRSFWVAVPLHAWQMTAMDVFCELRRHGDIDGIGPAALLAAFGFTG